VPASIVRITVDSMNAIHTADSGSKLPEFLFSDSPLLTIGGTVISFLIFWLTSKLFAGERGTFKNAVIYYVVSFLVSLAIGVIFGLLAHALPDAALIIGIAFLLVAIVLMFAVPMHIYQIGFFRALGLLLVSGLGSILAIIVIYALVIGTAIPKSQLTFLFRDRASQRESAAKSNDPAVLADEVQRMYTQLQEDRKSLNAKDAAAVDQFNLRVAKYNELRAQQAAAHNP
jgi:hypothetical protein